MHIVSSAILPKCLIPTFKRLEEICHNRIHLSQLECRYIKFIGYFTGVLFTESKPIGFGNGKIEANGALY